MDATLINHAFLIENLRFILEQLQRGVLLVGFEFVQIEYSADQLLTLDLSNISLTQNLHVSEEPHVYFLVLFVIAEFLKFKLCWVIEALIVWFKVLHLHEGVSVNQLEKEVWGIVLSGKYGLGLLTER